MPSYSHCMVQASMELAQLFSEDDADSTMDTRGWGAEYSAECVKVAVKEESYVIHCLVGQGVYG